MCMIDGADGSVTVLHERLQKAVKEHKCEECRRVIEPGEKYTVERYVDIDHNAYSHKTCSHCRIVRQWLQNECGGFLYHGVEEDIREHAEEGHYGVGVKMLAIGMERRWKRRDGRLWPVPRVPQTTHERMAKTESRA